MLTCLREASAWQAGCRVVACLGSLDRSEGTEARKKHVSRSNTIGVDNFAASQQAINASAFLEVDPSWQTSWSRGLAFLGLESAT